MDDINKEQQDNECLALESILGDNSFSYSSEQESGWMKVECTLQNSYISVSVSGDSDKKNVTHRINYLPPITVSFSLNKNYPSTEAPDFILSSTWLSKLQMAILVAEMDKIWLREEGNEILYLWYDFLQNEALGYLEIDKSLILGHNLVLMENNYFEGFSQVEIKRLRQRVAQDSENLEEVLPLLLTYNEERHKLEFNKKMFPCQICFNDKSGSNCIQFAGCNHVYCKQCMKSYFELKISEGSVADLVCPDPSCETTPMPHQIKETVDKASFERYDQLLLQVTLDTMRDITYCPLKHCQSAVIVDDSDERFAQCPTCTYSFCTLCRLTYHGPSACKVISKDREAIIQSYRSGDSAACVKLEKRYGRENLKKMLEEYDNAVWMKENSKPCPSCNAPIQKNDGCNKMVCVKCKCYFCWLCEQRLSRENPYKHYNDRTSPCNNQLFAGVDLGDMHDDDEWVYF